MLSGQPYQSRGSSPRSYAGGARVNAYGALLGGIVGVIGGRERPRLSADSTAIV